MPGTRRHGTVALALALLAAAVPSARAVPRVEPPPRAACSASAAWSCAATGALVADELRAVRRVRAAGGPVFPIRGPHDLGRSAANRFGGGRGHQGLDMFASCGTPVVAASAGRVERAAFEGAAGNYAVIALPDGQAEVYMHLRRAARVRDGDRVAAGERLGEVGATGDADGCHLHFERWTAPGWFRGRVVDPEPALRRWDAAAP